MNIVNAEIYGFIPLSEYRTNYQNINSVPPARGRFIIFDSDNIDQTSYDDQELLFYDYDDNEFIEISFVEGVYYSGSFNARTMFVISI